MSIWIFILGASAISTFGWVANNWIRARHGYPMEEEHHDDAPRKRQVDQLGVENQQLKAHIGRLEERLAVLERIATDPAEQTAREIERLR